MIGVDELLKRGYIDEKKLGVTGGSGGGLLTNWTIVKRRVSLLLFRNVTSPTGPPSGTWQTSLCSGDVVSKAAVRRSEDYKARSPITYINKVQTTVDVDFGRGRLAHAYRRRR